MPETHLKISKRNIGGNLGQVVFGEATYGPKGTCGPRLQPDYQLVIVLKGLVNVEIGTARKQVVVGPQHAILLRPGVREHFRFSSSGQSHHSWCAIDPRLVTTETAAGLPDGGHVFPVSMRLQQVMELGFGLPDRDFVSGGELYEILGQLILQLLSFEAREADRAGTFPAAIDRAMAYGFAHLGEPIQLEQLAEAAFVTKQHLNRLFIANVGISPMKWLWQKKLQRGLFLLMETGLSVQEVSLQSGFQSPYHFSRMVKSSVGKSPKEIRSGRI